MNLEYIPTLADAIKHYYGDRDLDDLCGIFGIAVNRNFMTDRLDYMILAKGLITDIDIGNNRRLLNALVPSLLNRAREGVAATQFQRREFHENILERLQLIESALLEGGVPEELTVAENHPLLRIANQRIPRESRNDRYSGRQLYWSRHARLLA